MSRKGGRTKVILDEYIDKTNIPKTTAKTIYKLTDRELELLKSTRKVNRRFRCVMTLYSRERVLTLACKKYGCTRKNIAEVLQQDRPPIVNHLVERKKPERKKKEPPAKTAEPAAAVPAAAVPATPTTISIVNRDVIIATSKLLLRRL